MRALQFIYEGVAGGVVPQAESSDSSSESSSKLEVTSPVWREQSVLTTVKQWRKELADCTLYKYVVIRREWPHFQKRDGRYTGMTGIVMKENVCAREAFYVYFADCSLESFHINELDDFNPEKGEDGAHFSRLGGESTTRASGMLCGPQTGFSFRRSRVFLV